MIKAPPAPPERITPEKRVPPRVVLNSKNQVTVFYHSGDLGDIIYSLLFVKAVGGGNFYVGPDSTWPTNSKLNPERYRFILPLLRQQAYIRKADYCAKVPSWTSYDLNKMRELWFDHPKKARLGVTNLFECYPARFGRPSVSAKDPWLSVPGTIIDLDRPVVIHRSERYRNDRFPWKEVVRRYAYRLRFVGLESEYREWINTWGNVATYRPVKDGLELAQVIAGAKLFIGNQSFPNSLALGLGTPVIQEAAPGAADCKIARGNAQYFESPHDRINWPSFGRRYVTTIPDANGVFELGPCAGAWGIGDTLTITPLVEALEGNVILKLPVALAHLAPLFTDLCPVFFTEDYPVFRHESNNQTWHMAESKLRLFGQWSRPIEPVIRITDEEKEWAADHLEGIKNPIAFVPTCKPEWAHIRQQIPEFWKDYIDLLKTKFSVLQFGLDDYATLSHRMTGYSIRQIAALYSQIRQYIGVDTGDVHMMLGVGGKALVFNPPAMIGHVPAEWEYRSCPQVKYVDPSNRRACDDAVLALV
jgi:ADP-heptose:LPS heptosyltransferase